MATTLTVQRATADTPLVPTYQAADATGNNFPNDARTLLVVNNGGGAAITVTIVGSRKCDQGFLHNAVVSVAAGTTAEIGPFNQTRFNDANSRVNATYSAVTSVTVAAIGQ